MKQNKIDRKVHEIDATGQSVGRLATRIVLALRGKHKVDFTPRIDAGDFVVVRHAAQLRFTGRKLAQK